MPIFQYCARSESGDNISGTLFAPDEDALYRTLRNQGLFLLRSRVRRKGILDPEKLRLSPRQILAFTIHVATYEHAGIPLIQTLNSLSRESFGIKFQALVEGLITRISSGSSFSEALACYPRVFDKHYVRMVAAGEASGQLDLRLEELVRHLEWRQQIRSQVRQSSVYPLLLIGLLSGVVILLLVFTLPRFVPLLEQFHTGLPMPTRIVITVSHLFMHNWPLIILIPAILYLCYIAVIRTRTGRYRLDQLKLRMPLFGMLHRKIALSRFVHHFSSLHAAGIDTLTSLKMVEGLVGNTVIGEVLRRVRQGVETGHSLSQQLSHSREFPPFVVQMLAAGEESGEIEGTLKKVCQYYDQEIPATIKRAFSIIEPLVLVIMGGLVVFIALSILLPIYEFGVSINK